MKYALRFSILLLMLVALGFNHSLNAQEITVRTVDWPPFYASSLKNGGPITDITRQALKLKGHTMDIKFIPWKRALESVKAGDADMVLAAYDTPERRADYLFSDRYYEVSEFIIGIEGKVPSTYKQVSDLKKYTFGLTTGYAYSKEINEKTLKHQYASADEQNIKKLIAGRVDLLVMNKGLFYDTLSRASSTAIKPVFLSPPLSVNGLYNMFSKQKKHSAKLVNDFNEGLKALKASGRYNEILKDHGILK